MQNKVIKGTNTPVVFVFSFTGEFASGGLSNFSDIRLTVSTEEYTTTTTPNNLSITSDTELRLNIGTDTSLGVGTYCIKIIGFSATYPEGYILVGDCVNPLTVRVVDC